MNRNATANWKGTGKDGKGTLTTQSTVLNNLIIRALKMEPERILKSL
jgi:hypothetical protein